MPSWVLALLQLVWGQTSGPLREAIVKSVKEWEVKARETKGPVDDIIVGIVKWILAIP